MSKECQCRACRVDREQKAETKTLRAALAGLDEVLRAEPFGLPNLVQARMMAEKALGTYEQRTQERRDGGKGEKG
jgi:hypothetical protein